MRRVSEGRGIGLYDLQAVARLLMPWPHERRNLCTRLVKLGSGEDAATLEITTWDKCAPRCTGGGPGASHDAARSVMLRVPCNGLPHCQSCECGSDHSLAVTDEQVRELLAALP